jgi:hypothetical protein
MFAVVSFALLGCGTGKPLEAALIYMPPDQYLHSFSGTILVSDLPDEARDATTAKKILATAQVTSSDALHLHMCQIQLPAEGAIDRKFRKCLFLVGLAGCNGAVIVPTGANPQSVPPGYERTCSDYWSDIYDRLKPNPQTGRD